jgi:hypothetical protein
VAADGVIQGITDDVQLNDAIAFPIATLPTLP